MRHSSRNLTCRVCCQNSSWEYEHRFHLCKGHQCTYSNHRTFSSWIYISRHEDRRNHPCTARNPKGNSWAHLCRCRQIEYLYRCRLCKDSHHCIGRHGSSRPPAVGKYHWCTNFHHRRTEYACSCRHHRRNHWCSHRHHCTKRHGSSHLPAVGKYHWCTNF